MSPETATKPLEILVEEAITTVRADGGEEEFETDTEHEDGHRDATPRRGAVPSCWHLRICWNPVPGVLWLPENFTIRFSNIS